MLDPIRSTRLLLRCWRPEDASRLKEAIDASLPELKAWVPWAMHEPSPVDAIETRLADMRQKFLSGHDWSYAIFDADETRLLGGAGLHPRGRTDHLEIGYWIRTDATGNGFAVEAARAMCVAGFAGTTIDHLEIHCDAENTRSAAVARRLGFQLTQTIGQSAVTARGEYRDTLIWTLPRSRPAYRSDLAFIHDSGYNALADDAARRLVDELRRAGRPYGTVVDLGCGSGILASRLVDAGYRVIGIDISEAMVSLARARSPRATFKVGSFLSADLPECVAVTAIGEVLNYGFDSGNDTRARRDLFDPVHRSLVPGGVFLFDVAGPDRAQPGGPHRTFAQATDWAVLVETLIDANTATLTREITTFRKAGPQFRRDAETHILTLIDADAVLCSLCDAGFEVHIVAGYGSMALPPGLTAIVARKLGGTQEAE